MHPECWSYVDEATRGMRVNADGPLDVLDIGGRNVNGSLRDLFPFTGQMFTAVDQWPGDGVDIVADAATMRLGRSFNIVICTEVLEHTPLWREVVETCAVHTRPGGLCVITAATDPRTPHSAIDGWVLREGEHYGNIDPAELHEVASRHLEYIDMSVLPRGDVQLVGEGK